MATAKRNKKGQFVKAVAVTKTKRRKTTVAKAVVHHRRKSFRLPPIAIAAGLLPGLANTWGGFQAGGLEGAAQTATVIYTGLDPTTGQWNFSWMGRGTIPILVGFLIHRGATFLGINRGLAAAGIPVRI